MGVQAGSRTGPGPRNGGRYGGRVTVPDDPRWSAVLEGLAQAGAPTAAVPAVVRDGAALLVRAGPVLIRVRPADGDAVARREVEVASVLATAGVPVTPLVAPTDQPWAIGDTVVTAWQWVDVVAPAGPDDLGLLARALRERTIGAAARVATFDPIEVVLGAVSHLPADDRDAAFVRARAGDLAGPWADAAADDPLGHAIVHGDLHGGNVVVGADGPLLTDLELSGGGPASYDVAATAVAVGRYGRPESDLEGFVDAYGADPRPWTGFATFVAVDELWGTAWAVGVRHLDQQWDHEAARRVESLRDGTDHRWRLS